MAAPPSLVDLAELADSMDTITLDAARAAEMMERVGATFASGDDVSRIWAAILLGALSDAGHTTADPSLATAAVELLLRVAGKTPAGDVFEKIDALCRAHALFGGASTGLAGARNQALAALRALGPLAAPAIDVLVKILDDAKDDDDARALAAGALGAIAAAEGGAHTGDARVTAALTRGIFAKNDPEGAVREAVLESLARLRSAGRPAIPELRKALADPACKYIHELAAETLAAIEAS
jgi:hypothetical protein